MSKLSCSFFYVFFFTFDVIAFLDVDGYELWKQKASELTSLRITVSDYLETTATPEGLVRDSNQR